MIKSQLIKLSAVKTTAKEIAGQLKGGEVLALVGPLGSGKTTFTQSLGKALKIRNKITSPTFNLMNVFPAGTKSRPMIVYHLDLYRAKNFREVKALGITELWGKPKTITVIEWADKVKKHLPKKTSFIYFEH